MLQFEELQGKEISNEELQIHTAEEILSAACKMDYIEVETCIRREDDAEILILKMEVSLPQRKKVPINEFEEVAIVVPKNRKELPEVFAIRNDFPTHLSHINLRNKERPVSICLYEENFDEIVLNWTPYSFLEIIRNWFSLQAKGKLHHEDQPLEPFIGGNSIKIILPSDYLTNENIHRLLTITNNENGVLFAEYEKHIDQNREMYLGIPLPIEPQKQNFIRRAPQNIADLEDLLKDVGIDFKNEWIKSLSKIKDYHDTKSPLLSSRLIIFIRVPIYRYDISQPERHEIYPFMLLHSVKEVLENLGLWLKYDNIESFNVLNPQVNHDAVNDFKLLMLNPQFRFSAKHAALYNGIEKNSSKITLIGLGALGSQIFNNFTRMGFGKWILIDHDTLEMHNLARHALSVDNVGKNKAQSLSEFANHMLEDDDNFSKAYPNNVLSKDPDLNSVINGQDFILDFSTSIAVERKIAIDIDSEARRISSFINQKGTDLVFLTEDKERKARLDMLEMQYYRCLIHEKELNDHYFLEHEEIRYARSCRDITATMPQDNISLFASIANKAIRNTIYNNVGSIDIWRINNNSIDIKKYSYNPSTWEKMTKNEWTIYIDKWLEKKLNNAREEKLPNETGGILIGAIDHSRKIVYLVDTILSPQDSEEYPTAYIRGIDGAYDKLKNIKKITAGNLDYIGEWHSHSRGATTRIACTYGNCR
ncbi:MAG: ThiF family adenylyltransferase [Halanaerobiales bacterium]